MKFIVRHGPLDEVDVRLADDTKNKIKRTAWVIYYTAAGTVIGLAAYAHVTSQKEDPNEEV